MSQPVQTLPIQNRPDRFNRPTLRQEELFQIVITSEFSRLTSQPIGFERPLHLQQTPRASFPKLAGTLLTEVGIAAGDRLIEILADLRPQRLVFRRRQSVPEFLATEANLKRFPSPFVGSFECLGQPLTVVGQVCVKLAEGGPEQVADQTARHFTPEHTESATDRFPCRTMTDRQHRELPEDHRGFPKQTVSNPRRVMSFVDNDLFLSKITQPLTYFSELNEAQGHAMTCPQDTS